MHIMYGINYLVLKYRYGIIEVLCECEKVEWKRVFLPKNRSTYESFFTKIISLLHDKLKHYRYHLLIEILHISFLRHIFFSVTMTWKIKEVEEEATSFFMYKEGEKFSFILIIWACYVRISYIYFLLRQTREISSGIVCGLRNDKIELRFLIIKEPYFVESFNLLRIKFKISLNNTFWVKILNLGIEIVPKV